MDWFLKTKMGWKLFRWKLFKMDVQDLRLEMPVIQLHCIEITVKTFLDMLSIHCWCAKPSVWHPMLMTNCCITLVQQPKLLNFLFSLGTKTFDWLKETILGVWYNTYIMLYGVEYQLNCSFCVWPYTHTPNLIMALACFCLTRHCALADKRQKGCDKELISCRLSMRRGSLKAALR